MEDAQSIAIVGCGGVGTYAAATVALAARGHTGLVQKIGLFDSDMIEEKNLARVPFYGYVGTQKAEALKEFLRHAIGFTNVSAHGAITADTIYPLLSGYDTIICCTDDIYSQRLIKEWCTRNYKVYQRAGYDGDTVNVCRQMPMTFDVEAEAADAGYHGVPEVYHAMLAGCLAAYSVLRTPITVMGEVAKLTVAGSTFLPKTIREAIQDALREEVQQDLADNGWHHEEDCQIPEGYHHYDDCDHENCISADDPDYVYVDDTPSRVMRNLPDRVIEYIQEQVELPDLEEMVLDEPKDAASVLETLHDDTHTTRVSWCPWCTLTQEED